MRNLLRKSVLLKIMLGVLVLLMYAPPSSAIAGVRRRAVRRTAIVVGSTEKSAAEKQQAAAQQQAAAAQQQQAASAAAAQSAAAASQASAASAAAASQAAAAASKRRSFAKVATATAGRAAVALQSGTDQRKRIQRREGEDPEFTFAVKSCRRPALPGRCAALCPRTKGEVDENKAVVYGNRVCSGRYLCGLRQGAEG